MLQAIHEEQRAQGRLLAQVMRLSVHTSDEVRTVRRLIEQASRHSVEIHEHEEKAGRQTERIAELEQRLHGPLPSRQSPPDDDPLGDKVRALDKYDHEDDADSSVNIVARTCTSTRRQTPGRPWRRCRGGPMSGPT